MRNSPAYPVSSADNVLRLLVMLREQGELRVAEAADRLGVAPSTAHRLLATLRQHDFAVQDRRRVYLPGPSLAGMGAAVPRPDLRVVIHRYLAELVVRCQETAHFTVLEGNGVRFTDGVEGSRPLRCGTRIGALMPAHVTSGGKALLAELSREQLRRLYPRGLPPAERGAAAGGVPPLARQLAEVARRGYATNQGESECGITAVGRCVRDRKDRALGAVTIAIPSARAGEGALAELAHSLSATCEAITGEL